MKPLNTMKFMSEATRQFQNYMTELEKEADLETAKKRGNVALGYIDCMTVFLNTMICTENNDFTGDLGALLDGWRSEVYAKIVVKAIDAKADPEYISKLFTLRDEYAEAAEEQWDGQ